MKIGVDASCWSNRRGFGRFTRELLRALLEADTENRYVLLMDPYSSSFPDLPPQASRTVVPTQQPPTLAAAAEGHRSLGDILRMSRATWGKFDLFFFPAVYSYFPLLGGAKCVVVFHDAIAERHPQLTFPDARARLFWNAKCWLARHQADVIVTVSQHSRDTLIEQWRLDPASVRVISEAPSSIFRPLPAAAERARLLARLKLPPDTRYLIYVGGISPHKNLEMLVDVFSRLVQRPACSDLKLLLVGDCRKDVFYSSFSRISGMVNARGQSGSIFFTDYVPDEELVHLYNGALALVFPSLEEGFGLPAVEAMACGTPVIASNAGSLPETVGEGGLFFDPRAAEELEAALLRVLDDEDLRRELSARALRRAGQFSWKQAAADLKRIFEQTG